MNLKIVLAAVVLISGGSYASYAQNKSSVSVTSASAAKAFETKVSAYGKETDAKKSTDLLESLKLEMINGLAAAKIEIANAGSKGDKDAADKWMKKYETRSQSYNDLLKNASDKTAVVSTLKKYAGTL